MAHVEAGGAAVAIEAGDRLRTAGGAAAAADRAGVVERLAPGVGGQELQAVFIALGGLQLHAVEGAAGAPVDEEHIDNVIQRLDEAARRQGPGAGLDLVRVISLSQVHARRAGVIDLEHQRLRQLTLDVGRPGLHIGRPVFKRVTVDAGRRRQGVEFGRGAGFDRLRQGEGVVDGGHALHADREVRIGERLREEERNVEADLAVGGDRVREVDEAVAGAHDGFAVAGEVVGQADARAEVLLVGPLVGRARDAVFPGIDHGQRPGVEVGEPVVLFGFRQEDFVTDTDVEGQAAIDADIVLDVQRVLPNPQVERFEQAGAVAAVHEAGEQGGGSEAGGSRTGGVSGESAVEVHHAADGFVDEGLRVAPDDMPAELEGVAADGPVPGAIELIVGLEGVDGQEARAAGQTGDIGDVDVGDTGGLAVEVDVADAERGGGVDADVLLGGERVGASEAGAELMEQVRLEDVGPVEGRALGGEGGVLETGDVRSKREAGGGVGRGGKTAVGLALGGLEAVVVVGVAEEDVVLRRHHLVDPAGVDVVLHGPVRHGGEVVEQSIDAARRVGQRIDAEDVAPDRVDGRGRHDVAGVGVADRGVRAGYGAGAAGVEDGQIRAPGGDQLAEVAIAHGGGGHRVDRGDATAGAEAGVVEEEEGLVLTVVELRNDDRAADGHAELVLPEHGLALVGRGKDVAGIEDVIAVELEDVAMEIVRAGLRGDGDHAGAAAELGGEDAGEGLELAHRFDGGGDDDRIEGKFVVIDPIDEPGVGVGAAAEGVEVGRAARVERGGAGEILAGLSGGNAGVEIDELREVPAVERQFADGAGADHFAEFGRFGADEGGGGGHLYGFRHIADRQLEVGAGLLVNFERQVLLHALLEAGLFHRDRVDAGHEERHVEGAGFVGNGAAGGILINFENGDAGAGYGGAGRIGDGA